MGSTQNLKGTYARILVIDRGTSNIVPPPCIVEPPVIA
jgi:hypothetical protein